MGLQSAWGTENGDAGGVDFEACFGASEVV